MLENFEKLQNNIAKTFTVKMWCNLIYYELKQKFNIVNKKGAVDVVAKIDIIVVQ